MTGEERRLQDIIQENSPPTFMPRRAASWWTTLDDLLWPEKKITDRIKRRAESFAKANMDTAINFGFHIRFDFSNYFRQLHGYFANVCDELHQYNIKFMEHYSCNHVERPRGEAELKAMSKGQRHHVLLFHDSVAAPFAQYEDHFFNDLCEVDIRNGNRGYANDYQLDVFCHNNPAFLDMHQKYLLRLMKEVPFDGIEVDDMCDYSGLTTCGCIYCRQRFKKDYGHEIPPFASGDFWGDTSKDKSTWGNYENPTFRDWMRMKSDGVIDHLKMIKQTIGDKPLMTCCSNAGPIVLNTIALNLEKMAPYLDFFMLENVGITIETINWTPMDAEALYQKDVTAKKANAITIAISYTIYPKGGYLGWCLSRFWGVSNWSSTLIGRLEENPADALEIQEIVGQYNAWDIANSDLNDITGKDQVEIRLMTSLFCRDNGWRDADGFEQWDRVKAWSAHLIRHQVGYRLLRSQELSDTHALINEHTPLVLDGVACVSDHQFNALESFLHQGGKVWLALPFGTHDEKGFRRTQPLSKKLQGTAYLHLTIIETSVKSDSLKSLIDQNHFKPLLKQVSGNPRWAARIRNYGDGPAIHFLYTDLVAVPHPSIKESSGRAILKEFYSTGADGMLAFEFDSQRINLDDLYLMTPELGIEKRKVIIEKKSPELSILQIDMKNAHTYAVAQKINLKKN